MTLETQLQQILGTRMKIRPDGLALTKLQGDASYRIYYRLSLPDGKSFIVMKLPEGKASASEEITNLKEKPAEPPFISVDRFLRSRGLPVPLIHDYEAAAGLIILEDFGDETLEKRVSGRSVEERIAWYQKAIDLLISFQENATPDDGTCLAHRRSFDATLLNWEFDHFLEYGVEARLSVKIPEEDRKKIHQWTGSITEALTRLPQVLVHRDFQSRNLMIQDEQLRLLDFQDALMGPLPYDLVALLRDSYVALDTSSLNDLIGYYFGQRAVSGMSETEFRAMFDWMTIQRKLKDAGRFVYIDRVKGNSSFLKHIPNSLAYVREAFERRKELKEPFELLKKYVPEFR